ncbi:hypothetical protein DH09_10665 [Bacillaceae bacterium JMAK1]|nr:hypothetical protein DH09_10665 [Bacillaceae bacterium JMAK1]
MNKCIPIFLSSVLFLTGCSTMGMERHLSNEREVDLEQFGYEEDDDFTLNESVMYNMSDLTQLDQLSTSHISSIIADDLDAGHYNEWIVFFRDWVDEEPEEAAPFTNLYYDALLAHIESPFSNSEELVTDAIQTFSEQYESDPLDHTRTLRLARALMESGRDVERGAEMIFEWAETANDEELGSDGFFTIARAHHNVGNFEESIEIYDQLTTLSPDDASIYYLQSQAYREMGDDESAQDAMEMAFAPSRNLITNFGDDTLNFYQQFLEESVD